MSPLGITEQFLRPRTGTQGRRERFQGEWRDQDGLLLVVGAALLSECKDSAAARQTLARILGRGLLNELCLDLARSDAGAAGMALQLAARLHPSAPGLLRDASVRQRRLDGEEEMALAEWLRLAVSAAERILDSPRDARLRSSIALAWGRLAKIAEDGAAWLEDEDPRVRANAVESLWGRSDEQAVSVFVRKLADPHHRVAANSAVGLYRAGRAESIAALRNLAGHSNAAWRAAGVWAIGRTGDARFLPLLGEMRRMRAAPVALLRNVVLARERIRQVEELPRRPVELRIGGIPAEGGFRCTASLMREPMETAPPLRPTDFALAVNGQAVWEYRAWRSSLAGPDAFCLAVPGPDAELAARRASEIAAEAGESAQALFRLALGYDGGDAEHAKTGDILGLSSPSATGAWFAASPAAWSDRLRRAAQRLAEESPRPCVAVAVGRGCPEWLSQALSASARECASLGLGFAVLHEPASLSSEVLGLLRHAGAQTASASGGFAAALREILQSPRETWILEAPGIPAGSASHVKLVLRSGWLQGDAEFERAS